MDKESTPLLPQGEIPELGAPKIVRDLAEGYSTQSKITNRFWVSLLPLIFLILLPSQSTRPGLHALPFGFGDVDEFVFRQLSFFIFSALFISFSAARAQALITYTLAHTTIDKIEVYSKNGPTPRQFFDMLHTPALLRVGSLAAQAIFASVPGLKRIAGIYYFVVKASASVVFYGIPFYTLLHAFTLLLEVPNLTIAVFALAAGFLAISSLALVQNIWAEAKESNTVRRKLRSPKP